jgi:hypothetical protein
VVSSRANLILTARYVEKTGAYYFYFYLIDEESRTRLHCRSVLVA